MDGIFVHFTGEESEKEFLEKCLEQWDRAIEGDSSEFMKFARIGTIIREIRHRIEELD